MSQDKSIDDIREQKKQELQNTEENGEVPSEPIHVDGAVEFDEVTGDNGVVLVDFYADWCGPCKMVEPVVEELAAETEAAVAKVDVDANQQLAAEYGVQGVPTLLLFANGNPVERIVGVQDKAALQQTISQYT